MALPSSRTPQATTSSLVPVLVPVRKRRHDSSSSESSSSTVKATSVLKALGKRPTTQALRDKNQDKKKKKRSRPNEPTTTNRFDVGSQREQRTAEPLSGGPSHIEIEERRSLETGVSNAATKISSDSEAWFLGLLSKQTASLFPQGDDELVEQVLQLDPNESPSIPSEISTLDVSVRGVVRPKNRHPVTFFLHTDAGG